DHCHNAVAEVVKEFGRIDVLVNNAAFQIHSSDFSELTEEHFDTTLKTNLYGYFHMAQEAVPHMKPGSAIINSGSITGIEGSKQLVDYSMTKGGIHAFTRALSGNLIEKGIR
ncbi:MAG: SDR family oxidoreductase, partial [Mesorhizobium sp.]